MAPCYFLEKLVIHDFLYPVVCAVTQGISEAFPVSSSFHFTLISWALGVPAPSKELAAVLHTGSFLALCLIFRQDIRMMLQGFFGLFIRKTSPHRVTRQAAASFYTIMVSGLGLISGVGIFFGLKTFMVGTFSLSMMAIISMAFSLILEGVNQWQKKRMNQDAQMYARTHAFWIGMSQVLAMVCSGISRLGITLTVGRFLGYSLHSITRFSLIMGIPVLGASILFSLPRIVQSPISVHMFLMMTIVTFLCSWPMFHVMLWVSKKECTWPFTLYRMALGGAVLWLTRSL